MENGLMAHEFVHDWLNHFNYNYETDVEVNSTLQVDFIIREVGIGVYIVDWKKPISIQIANKAIQIQRELGLHQLFLVAREISEPAIRAINKFGKNITMVHPNGLSELAVALARSYQGSPLKVTS